MRAMFILALALVPMASPAQETGERQEPRGPGAADLGATTDRFLMTGGEAIYQNACAGCHQPQGQGAYGAGIYPPLAGNARLEGARYPVWILLNGMGGMPAFNDWLTDEQIVEVTTYLQQNLGNRYTNHPTVQMVADLRDDLGEPIPKEEN